MRPFKLKKFIVYTKNILTSDRVIKSTNTLEQSKQITFLLVQQVSYVANIMPEGMLGHAPGTWGNFGTEECIQVSLFIRTAAASSSRVLVNGLAWHSCFHLRKRHSISIQNTHNQT